MSKIKLGNIYIDSYGDKRIPVTEEGEYTKYLDFTKGVATVEMGIASYNPYKNYIKITNFIAKFEDTGETYIKDIDRAVDVLVEAEVDWKNLIAKTSINIFNLCR